MSHLKPNKVGEVGTKDFADYTPSEKASALTQMQDAAGQLVAKGKPIAPATAKLMTDFAKGTEKEGTLSEEVEKASAIAPKADASPKGKSPSKDE